MPLLDEKFLTEAELAKKITKFLNSRGYNKVPFPVERTLKFEKEHSMLEILGINAPGKLRLIVNFALRTIQQIVVYEEARDYVKLDNAILKFFDNLDFTTAKGFYAETQQETGDWFWNKAQDGVDIRILIDKFLTDKGYEKSKSGSKLRYTKEVVEGQIFPTDLIEIYLEGNKFISKTRYSITIHDDKTTNAIGPFKFTNDELRFFDSLGFTIYFLDSDATGQDIEDWF